MLFAICPQCGGYVYLFENPEVGDEVQCRHCHTALEVTRVEPVELDWPWEIGEESLEDIFDEWEAEEAANRRELYTGPLVYDAYDDDDFSYARIKHDD